MNTIIERLKGKKTHIIAALMAGYGIALILQGQSEQGINTILSALGFSALRAGVAKQGTTPMIILMAGILMLLVAGCETKTITSPAGWTAKFDRVLVENSFDKATIIVDPNGTATIMFEKYKSDGTRALETLEKVVAAGSGMAAGTVVAP